MGPFKAAVCSITACVCLSLTGCGQQQTLAQREIVRAVFLERQKAECKAVLLVEDTDLPEGESGYKTADGTGDTFEKAICEAELSLDGTPFYGLMDLVTMPLEADWETVTQAGQLLYEQAQPAPEMTLFLLDAKDFPLPKSAGELYDILCAATKTYKLHGGLEGLFVQQDFCALPVWQEEGMGFAFLRRGQQPVRLDSGLEAQLAAVLCGQIRHLESYYAQESAYCAADTTVQWDAEKENINILLHLRKTSLADLSGQERPQSDLESILETELQSAFQRLNQTAGDIRADPFRLNFWKTSVMETTVQNPLPQLIVEIEP